MSAIRARLRRSRLFWPNPNRPVGYMGRHFKEAQ